MRGLSWWTVTRRKTFLNSFFMPCDSILVVSSRRICDALTVAATAARVLDCNASASKPIEALLMPVLDSRMLLR